MARETNEAAKNGLHVRDVEGLHHRSAEVIEAGEALDLDKLITPDAQKEIGAAFEKLGFGSLGAVREHLGERYDYGVLRIFRAAKNAERRR